MGEVLREVLGSWKGKHALVGDVRGLGPMMLVEFVRDHSTREPAPEETLAVIRKTVQRGVIAMRAGLFSNCIRFLPPLVITEAELREALGVMEAALAEVEAARPAGAGAR